jgi:AcrR family transcriptional regulator
MAKRASAKKDLLETVFEVLAERGRSGDVARESASRAGVSLAELYRRFPSEGDLLRELTRRVDETMLDADEEELEGLPPRDRVFELMMRRFETLQPFQAGLRRLAADGRRDPVLMLSTAIRLDRSLSWLQAAAGLPAAGLRARFARRILGLAYLRTMQVWFDDEGRDMAKTMAELDQALRRIETVAGLSERTRSASPAAEPAGQPA